MEIISVNAREKGGLDLVNCPKRGVGKMVDVYNVLRGIDYLKTSVDNLQRESYKFKPSSTTDKDLLVKKGREKNSWEEMFIEQCDRVDSVAKVLNSYVLNRQETNLR